MIRTLVCEKSSRRGFRGGGGRWGLQGRPKPLFPEKLAIRRIPLKKTAFDGTVTQTTYRPCNLETESAHWPDTMEI